MVYIFGWLFKFLKSLRKCSKLVLGLGCLKYGAPHSELFAISRTPSRNKLSTSYLNIFPCTFGTGYVL